MKKKKKKKKNKIEFQGLKNELRVKNVFDARFHKSTQLNVLETNISNKNSKKKPELDNKKGSSEPFLH